MTRDETVALFSSPRRNARRRGRRRWPRQRRKRRENAAHEAAKAHWNAWAEPLLAERKAMEADGRWAAEKRWGDLEPKNAETRAWMEKAAVLFSRCLFLVRGVEGTKRQREKKEENGDASRLSNQFSLRETRDFSGLFFRAMPVR